MLRARTFHIKVSMEYSKDIASKLQLKGQALGD